MKFVQTKNHLTKTLIFLLRILFFIRKFPYWYSTTSFSWELNVKMTSEFWPIAVITHFGNFMVWLICTYYIVSNPVLTEYMGSATTPIYVMMILSMLTARLNWFFNAYKSLHMSLKYISNLISTMDYFPQYKPLSTIPQEHDVKNEKWERVLANVESDNENDHAGTQTLAPRTRLPGPGNARSTTGCERGGVSLQRR